MSISDRDYYDYDYDFYAPAWTDRLLKRPPTWYNNLFDCGLILVFLAVLPFMILTLILITAHLGR
jgi:hypothetical protein